MNYLGENSARELIRLTKNEIANNSGGGGTIDIDLEGANEGEPNLVDSDTLGGKTESELSVLNSVNSETLGGKLENELSVLNSEKLNNFTLAEIMLKFYPVGAIYTSTIATNPAELFGGEWTQIQGRFLLAASSSYAAGSTGGEATHTLTVNEMPKHGHNVFAWNKNNTNYDAYSVNSAGTGVTKASSGASLTATWNNAAFKTAGNNNLGIGNTNGTGDPSGVTDFKGGNAAHNNMPPYLAVYVWQRTA